MSRISTSGERNGKTTRQETCTNNLVDALLTDLYQVTMAYAYWKTKKHEVHSVFDLYFRKNPFHGEYTIFCGLGEVLCFLQNYKFSAEGVEYLKGTLPHVDSGFWDWLQAVDLSQVKVYAIKEGTVVFPHTPLIRVEGPLAICQLLETTLLNLVNYASLVATNAARHRVAAGKDKVLLEFGLRRAQGPDGGVSASRYAIMGGYNASSNVKAGQIFKVNIAGTQAHSFISSFIGLSDLSTTKLESKKDGKEYDFLEITMKYRKQLPNVASAKENELAAFLAYAMAFPNGFLALTDTYNTIHSGAVNFLAVALALDELGYKAVGIRLDSGDLAYFSKKTRDVFKAAAKQFNLPYIADLKIVASSDISEEILHSLVHQNSDIDIFGIGTNLVTCKRTPALGCVYKLVEVDGLPRMKISNNVEKVSIPGKKDLYRLFGQDNRPILDLMVSAGTEAPKVGERILCQHPYVESKRAWVRPSKVGALFHKVWDGKRVDTEAISNDIYDTREYVLEQIYSLREDILRYVNPTPYKVSVDRNLYKVFHDLWTHELPIEDLQ